MPKPKEKQIPTQNSTETPQKPMTKREELEQKKRELSRKVVNTKAEIFDIIEAKSEVQQDIAVKQEQVKQMGEKILEIQRVLNGDRKVLKGLEAEIIALQK